MAISQGGSNLTKDEGKKEMITEQHWYLLAKALIEFHQIARIREGMKDNSTNSSPKNALTGKENSNCYMPVNPKPLLPEKVNSPRKCKRKEEGKRVIKKRKVTQFGSEMEKTIVIPCELGKRIKEKGGDGVKLVMRKRLFKTDLSISHSRLTIPLKQIVEKTFLSEQEKQKADMAEGLKVMFMNPSQHDSEMVIKRWVYQNEKCGSYALRSGWNDVVRDNEFKENDEILIISFRVDGGLWLTIHKVSDGADHNFSGGSEDGASTSQSFAVDQENKLRISF